MVGARLPSSHVEFLLSLQLQFRHASFLCVHAGLAPDRSLEEQREEDLLWIRDEFILHAHPFPFTVVFGHTPRREVLVQLPQKVGLDTGLVYWNKLSCLELERQEIWQIRRGDVEVRRRLLRARTPLGDSPVV